jgi:hypothetical protein
MKLRFLLLVLALTTATVAARAQGAIYFNPVVTRVSNSTPDYGPFAFLGQGGTSQIFGGVMFGGYGTVLHQPKFDVSLDLRDQLEHGGGASLNSLLFGVRVSASHLSNPRLKPYLEILGGDGRSKSQLSAIHISKFEYDAFLGADYALNRHVDWRIAEIGYGQVTTSSSSIYGGPTPHPPAHRRPVSTRVGVRVPKHPRRT